MTSMWLPPPPLLVPLQSHVRPSVIVDMLNHSPTSSAPQESFQCLPPISTLSSSIVSPVLSPAYSSTTFVARKQQEQEAANIWHQVKHHCAPSTGICYPSSNVHAVQSQVSQPSQASVAEGGPGKLAHSTMSMSSTVTSASSPERNAIGGPHLQGDAYVGAPSPPRPSSSAVKSTKFESPFRLQHGAQPQRRHVALSTTTKPMQTHVTCPASNTVRKVFVCPVPGCSQTSSNKGNLSKHIATRHELRRDYVCPFAGCSRRFAKKYNMLRHLSASGVHPRSNKYLDGNSTADMTCASEEGRQSYVSQLPTSLRKQMQSNCKRTPIRNGSSTGNTRVRKCGAPRARWSAWELELAHFLAVRCAHHPPPRRA